MDRELRAIRGPSTEHRGVPVGPASSGRLAWPHRCGRQPPETSHRGLISLMFREPTQLSRTPLDRPRTSARGHEANRRHEIRSSSQHETKAITEAGAGRPTPDRTRGSQAATERARKVMPLGVLELPVLRPASDRRPPGAGRVDGRRRRQPLHRLRHGLRRAVRRAHATRSCAPRSSATRRRHPVRDAVRAERRGRRAARRALRPADVAVHQLRHGSHDGRDPRRPRDHRPGQDRQGRGWLSRPPRRGDDLDEAVARPGRSGRSRRHSVPATAGITAARARRHVVIPYNDAAALERVLRAATSPRSSSSR